MACAAELFATVVGDKPDVVREPIQALAKAGWANALAQHLIFWQDLLHEGRTTEDPQELIAWKRADLQQIRVWRDQVKAITDEIERDLEKIQRADSSAWDEPTRLQLEWARLNALGSDHLNLATGFLWGLCPPEWETVEGDRKGHLKTALDYFRRSERVLTPGPETLANLGTTLLYLGRQEQARDYFTQAMALNPLHEYAYCRLAQSWDWEEQRDKVVEVLKSYQKPVVIRHFRRLYEKYGVPVPGGAAGLA